MLVAWRAVGGGQRWYLWVISDRSSKKPVDAANLSLPLYPTHYLSMGLMPPAHWHPMACSGLWYHPGLGTEPATCMSGEPRELTLRGQTHSALFAPASYAATPAAVVFCVLENVKSCNLQYCASLNYGLLKTFQFIPLSL